MGTQFLIDTSAVIKYLSQTFPTNGKTFIEGFIDTDCTISFISEIELQVWVPANPANIVIYQQFVKKALVRGINPALITESIIIRKNYRLKIPDAIIAATAITDNRTLIGDNDKDFLRVPNLKYINPRTL